MHECVFVLFCCGCKCCCRPRAGWTPSTFVSSRNLKAETHNARPEDFMDEEVRVRSCSFILFVFLFFFPPLIISINLCTKGRNLAVPVPLRFNSYSAGPRRARHRAPTDHHHRGFRFWEDWSDQGQSPSHQLPHCSHPRRHSAGGADRTRTVPLHNRLYIRGVSCLSVVASRESSYCCYLGDCWMFWASPRKKIAGFS